MNVTKRNGSQEQVSFDKVTNRLKILCEMKPKLTNVNYIDISQKVVSRIYDGVHTYELDDLAAQLSAQMGIDHMEYTQLASRIAISNNQKRTSPSFSETITILFNNIDSNGSNCSLISEEVYHFVIANKSKINDTIDYTRDFNFDYFALKTLEKAYLMKVNGVIVERIQDMLMRVSIGLHCGNLKDALETYDLISDKYFTHATPTLFHSGTPKPQLLSCFLLEVPDSVEGMYDALKNCALISKWAGGIGCHIHSVRGKNSIIRSTNGKSNGLIPLMRVFNDTARHINQSGRRNGSFAMYLEPWHPDIMEFLECKKNHGDENARARDLFYAIWMPDLFMERLKNNENWSLLCPDKCKYLPESYGADFKKLYEKYEENPDNIIKSIPTQKIWKEILAAQMETGTPYICYKDACNIKSNQKNLGTIKSSNLCTEIMEYSNTEEYACCTLASIGLPQFVIPFDFSKIKEVIIYSKTGCEYCKYAKKYLESYGICYEEISVDGKNIRDKFFEKLNNSYTEDSGIVNKTYNTVPQIYINNDHIGGFNELFTYFKPRFNFKKLVSVTKRITENLNKVIDLNFYPVIETKRSNLRHRPLGIGIQGLADVYAMFKYSFDSDEAKELNKQIFATIYYSSCKTSMELSKNRIDKMKDLKKQLRNCNDIPELYDQNAIKTIRGEKLYHELKASLVEIKKDTYLGSYSSFEGSPMSKGKFQFDLWNESPINNVDDLLLDWKSLRRDIMIYGMRNSLFLAPMPTASTSQILGNNECIEPFTSNIYSRSTLAGEFLIVNKYLQDNLTRLGIWNRQLKDKIILNSGSIQNMIEIPEKIRDIYRISWDLSMKALIDQAADRGIYVCQSQSLNLWVKDPTYSKLSSMHMYSWKKGLKTGIYYLRRRAVVQAQTFSIDPENEECLMCSA